MLEADGICLALPEGTDGCLVHDSSPLRRLLDQRSTACLATVIFGVCSPGTRQENVAERQQLDGEKVREDENYEQKYSTC